MTQVAPSTNITRAATEQTLSRPTSARAIMRRLVGHMTDFIVPPTCLGCRERVSDRDTLCSACWREITFIRAPLCDRLGIPLAFDPGGPIILSASAMANPPAYQRARAAATFGPVVRGLVHSFKYADSHTPRHLFANWLKLAGHELLADADLIVPIPLHHWRLASRRFNQAAILANDLHRLTGVPSNPLVLVRTRRTSSQVGLTLVERKANVRGAVKVRPSRQNAIQGRRIILVDDVITTGATISAAADVLLRAGAAHVDALALALVTDDSRITS